MKKSYQLLCLLLALSFFSTKSSAQNNLAAGDLAIASYQSDFDPTNPVVGDNNLAEFEDRFSLIITKPGGIAAGTVIFFTTRGWNGPANTWHDEDFTPFTFGLGRRAVVQWTVPAGGIAQGTEVFFINKYHDEAPVGQEYYDWAAYANEAGTILINNLTNVTPIVPAANSTDGMSFAVSGDKLLIYQTGPPAGPNAGPNNSTIRFITALQANINGTTVVAGTTNYATWDAVPGAMAGQESSIPPGLVNGQTCFLMSPSTMPNVSNGTTEPDNGKFSACALASAGACTALQMSAIIYATNPVGTPTTPNWTYSNSVFPLGTSSSLCTYNILPTNTSTLTSAVGTNSQTRCINTAITNITYSTTGATGATFSGLPAGVTGNWAANVVTISGSPTTTVGSPFTYTVTLTGGCGTTTSTGTITVTPNNTSTLTSAVGTNAQTVCINTPVTNITYSTTGAAGATFSGLPAGVTGNWAANVVTISGSPTTTVGSPFNYTVTLTGGCGVVISTGTITVNGVNTATLSSGVGTNAQTVNINTPITNITYATTGATGATFSGLPAGVTGNWAANVVTISGSPTTAVGSPFSYTVTLTGGCGTVTSTGTITVTTCAVTLTSAVGTNAQTVCINTPITNITYSTVGATGATFSGLPAGVTGNWVADVITISGTPTTTVGSPFSYTITQVGGACAGTTATGTITVNPDNTITLSSAPATTAQTVCINTPIVNITYNTTGATGATFSGLPAGVTGAWAANVVTISGSPTTTVGSPFNYTVTLTGGCGTATASGSITVNPNNTITLTSAPGTNAQTVCVNTPITNITYSTTSATGATFSGLPAGVTGNWAANVVTISGTPTSAVGSPFNYTVTLTGGCGTVTATGTITVNANNTITLSSAPGTNAQTVCINTPITNITYNTTGATGATFSGLPAGVTGAWAANVVTISGSPTTTVGSPFNYTVTLTGGCGSVTANGTITVNPNNTITLTSAPATTSQTVCVNTPITNITYSTTGATGATFSGLPAGVTGNWAANVVTISGTATASGTFNYTVTETGGCPVSANGTITVSPNNTITLSSAPGTNTQTVCINTAITNITYNTTGATGATFSGLPAGVTGNWVANVVTISGSPNTTVGSPFSYTVTLTGGCGTITATGSITVNPNNTMSLTSAPATTNQTVLVNTPITNVTYSTTGATGATFSGLPAGVTGNWAANTVTISGTPTVLGTFNYTISLTGGCGAITANGTIDVVACSITRTSAAGTDAQTVCNNTPITNITYATTGATGASFTGLPAGVTGAWAANVATISGTPTVAGTFGYVVTLTGGGCGAFNATGTITVNPTPDVTQPANQAVCNNTATAAVNFTGSVPGTVFNWTNSDPSIGLAASGTGNIPSFTAINASTAPLVATVTVTPSAVAGGGPGSITMPAQISTFATNARGYWFTAPTNFTITALRVPTDASAGNQSIAVLRFTGNTPPPVFASTTNAFTTLFLTQNDPTPGNITVSIPVNAGEVIGILGVRADVNSYGDGSGGITIAGFPVSTVRMGMQLPLSTNAPQSIWQEPGNTSISRVFFDYTSGVTCTGQSKTFTYTVKPTPTAVAAPASQTVCSASPITTIAISGNAVAGVVYNWTRDNTGTVTGIAASGAGDISGTLTNTTNVPITVTFTITPTANGCPGAPVTATVLVNPTPNAVATPSSQTICSGSTITTVSITGNVSGTVYNWTRDNTVAVTGIGANGSGNISGALTNTTNAPVTVTFTITPTANGCPGAATTATVLVNPIPNATATPTSQTICSGSAIIPIVNSGVVSGTVYNWTRDNPIVTGIVNSGTGNISGTLTNATNTPITVTFTITPSYTNGGQTCLGTPVTATVVVNPTPDVNQPANQVVCNGGLTAAVNFTGSVTAPPGTVYTWTNNTPGIGLAAGPLTGNIASFTAINNGTAPVTATITVTPSYTNGGTTCTGSSKTFTITVNPTPVAVVPANAVVCNGTLQPTGTYNFTTTATGGVTTYTWSNNNINIGLGGVGAGNSLPTFTATNNTTAPITGTITVTPTFTNGGVSCTGPSNSFTITVNPTPNATAAPTSQIICTSTPITTIVLTGTVPGTVFNWTRDNGTLAGGPVSGIAASGSGNISGTLNNTQLGPVMVTFTITPSYTNGGVTCTGPSVTATVTVNPVPNVTVPANQIYCNGTTVTTGTLNFTSTNTPAGTTVFTWTNDNINIGLGASGNGQLPTFTTTNATPGPIVGTIVVTPHYTNAGGGPTCDGPAQTFTITVNPIPNVTVPVNQIYCNGTTVTTGTLNFTSTNTPAGTTVFTWTNSNTNIGLGANGTGQLPTFTTTNATLGPITGTIVVTPHYTNAGGGPTCDGPAQTFTITVNPTPNVTVPANQVYCNNTTVTTGTLNFTSTNTPAGTTVFTWTNSNTNIGLGASGAGNSLPTFTTTNPTNGPITGIITVTPHYTNAGGGPTCDGPSQTFTITVNPTATVNPVANQTVCTGSPTAAVTFSSPTTGGTIVYNWTNTNPTIGLVASGIGNIPSFIGLNITNAPNAGTIVVTPTYTSGGVSCVGIPISFTITINPVPVVNPVPNQTVCNGAPTTSVVFASPTTGGIIVYNWTNSNTAIGLGALGVGNIPSFIATNPGTAPISGTITVTPTYTNNGVSCTGPAITFTITVNPTPTVNPVANQVVCNNTPTAAVTFTGAVPGTVYTWTNTGAFIGLGPNGVGNIPSFIATNPGNVPLTATITVTPTYTGGGVSCSGAPVTFTITVNPTPTVNQPVNQVLCNGSPTAAVTFTGTVAGTVYTWTNNNITIGLGASGTGNIPSFIATNAGTTVQTATIVVTPTYTNGGVSCTGASKSFTITVNPIPTVNAIADLRVCSGTLTAVTFTGATAGTVYNWTNNNTAIGLPASGAGNLNFIATNTSAIPIFATITVTPSFTNGGVTCTGASKSFVITVNPTPTADQQPNQVLCNGSPTTAITFTGSASGAFYTWTNNQPSIGLGAFGAGDIPSFIALNAGTAPVVATVTVTPVFIAGGVTCTGPTMSFTITVNPTPSVNAIANQILCSGSTTTAVTITGPVAGTVYNWTNNNISIGLAASGTATVPAFVAINNTNAAVTATITVTPIYTNAGVTCSGTPISFTITVNPKAVVNQPADQLLCNGSNTTTVIFTGLPPGSTYSWTNSNTSIGLAASGTGNIASFAATNATTTVQTATITVTPSSTGCVGLPVSFTITVNPTPTVNQPANQTVCAGTSTAAVPLSGAVAGTVYTWTNNNTSIGLGASGTGTVPAFVTVNPTVSAITATITVTPTYTNGGISCTGASKTFTITVNPLPNIVFDNVPPRVCLTDTIVILKATPLGGTWSGVGVSGNTFSATAAGLGVKTLSYTSTNVNGCTQTSYVNITVNDCAERHNIFANAIRIYPNPNGGRFNIRFNSDVYSEFNVRVIDAAGRVYRNQKITGLRYGSVIPMNMSDLASGTYFLQIYNESERAEFPLVIVR